MKFPFKTFILPHQICIDIYLHILANISFPVRFFISNLKTGIMHQLIKAVTLIVIFFITRFPEADAQMNLSKWQVGANAGVFVYQGDLTPVDVGSYNTIKPVFGFHISRVLNPSFLLRTNVEFGKLHGNDSLYSSPVWRKQRNYNFTASVTELSELVVWNMFGNNRNEKGYMFSPYLFAGAGVSFLKINRDYSNFNSHYFATDSSIVSGLKADINHAPPRAALVLPLGLGMEFYLTPKFSLTAETNFRFTFTDYLDGFSVGANAAKNDFYHSHTIGLLYRFGKNNQSDCPVIKR